MNFVDLNLTYIFNPRFSATLSVPFSVNNRSQVVRSNDVNRTILFRYSTQADGLGDLRLVGNAWLFDPPTHPKGNILFGVGLDMPTGQKDAKDIFPVFSGGQILAQKRTVDQSIQPGDGGWGAILELFAYQELFERCDAYVQGMYTITPEEQNHVLTYRGSPFEKFMSISDTYMGRAGFEYVVWPKHGLTFSLGGRVEGVPVHDLVGGSDWFRRPGYAVSIEPGVSASFHSWSVAVSTPVALYRNREKSVPDKQRSNANNTSSHGDAAFADFLVQGTVSKRF